MQVETCYQEMLPLKKNQNYNRQSGKSEITNNCPFYLQIQGQIGLYGL